jgi:hypothetical protein
VTLKSAFAVSIIAAATIAVMSAIIAFAPRCPANYPAIVSGYVQLGGCR